MEPSLVLTNYMTKTAYMMTSFGLVLVTAYGCFHHAVKADDMPESTFDATSVVTNGGWLNSGLAPNPAPSGFYRSTGVLLLSGQK
jgi:hypothetical protein